MYGRLAAFVLLGSSIFAHAIGGTVVTVDRGEPLARVQVEILETGAQTITNREGNFTIAEVAPGSYRRK
jgi:hypothetical protein